MKSNGAFRSILVIARVYVDPGTRADPEKKALFGAATKVIHLTKHIGTELVGLQLKDLTDQQKDELALLIAERSVVFFRDQELNPRQQLELGEYYGEIEVHPQAPRVPGLDGITVIWPDYNEAKKGREAHFRKPGGSSGWHTDLVHEKYPAGITHLHNVYCRILKQL
jgi:alpha-ketoglutarate-dependent taurine dioxygenase